MVSILPAFYDNMRRLRILCQEAQIKYEPFIAQQSFSKGWNLPRRLVVPPAVLVAPNAACFCLFSSSSHLLLLDFVAISLFHLCPSSSLQISPKNRFTYFSLSLSQRAPVWIAIPGIQALRSLNLLRGWRLFRPSTNIAFQILQPNQPSASISHHL